MSKRLDKRELSFLEKLNIPRKDLVMEISKDFLSSSSIFYQESFEIINKQFFDNSLRSLLVVGVDLKAGGTYHYINAENGFIAIQSNVDTLERECILLHELQHYDNHINGVDNNGQDHSSEWAESCQHILDKLNIKLEAKELTEDELKSFPYKVFENYNLTEYFKSNFEYSRIALTPLPDNFELQRKAEAEIEIYKSVVCTGDAQIDIEKLITTFGDEYKTKLKELLC